MLHRPGNPSKAAEIINSEIRTARVVKEGHDLSEAQVSASDMTIDWIMEERARELCGEHIRWFDMKRIYGPRGTFAQTFTAATRVRSSTTAHRSSTSSVRYPPRSSTSSQTLLSSDRTKDTTPTRSKKSVNKDEV